MWVLLGLFSGQCLSLPREQTCFFSWEALAGPLDGIPGAQEPPCLFPTICLRNSGYGGCSWLGLPDSPNCQSLLFCMAIGFVLGLNSGSSEGRLHLETLPSGSAVGLAVRLSKAAQQAAGPTGGDTARGRRLHPAASTPPHPGGSS